MDCNVLTIDTARYKQLVTPEHGSKDILDVSVSMEIQNIEDFNIMKMSYRAKFDLILKWFDARLKYKHLKNMTYQNRLSSQESKKLWIPSITLNNSNENYITHYELSRSLLVVNREQTNGNSKNYSQLDEVRLYDGRNNSLELHTLYDTTFKCSFELEFYPFNAQKWDDEAKH